MLKLRPIENQITRDIMDGDNKIGEEILTHEVYYSTGRYRTVPVTSEYDVFSENIRVLNHFANELKKSKSPYSVNVNGFEYRVNERTRSALREICELSEDDETYYEFSCINGESLICASDAKCIRKKMLDETQVVFRKFKGVSDLILEIKNEDDVEKFNLEKEWNKA